MKNKFESLELFHQAHSLVLLIYNVTKSFPKTEQFGLTNQLRRAVASVVANIIEGSARKHKKEFIQFLYLAKGSLEETKYHLLLARDLGYLSKQEYEELQFQAENVGRLLGGLIKYLQTTK